MASRLSSARGVHVLRHPRGAVLVAVIVVVPLVATAVVLAWRPWVPVLDMAMTEFRVRDVGGRNSPLVGLPGRIGTFPDQGSHPGPWSFWLIAPFYRIGGSTAWGMELGSLAINAACVGALVWMGARRYGTRGALVLGAIAAVAVRGYGLTVLSHPWNPYFPVLLWLVALVAAWMVLCGDDWLALVTITASTVAAQTHIPYLVSAVVLDALVLGVLGWRVVAERRSERGNGPIAPLGWMLAIAAALWVLPLVEQARQSPGNLTKIVRHFTTDQPEPSLGLSTAASHLLRHLDVFDVGRRLLTEDDAFVQASGATDGFAWGGLVVLLAWAAAAGWAVARRHRDLLALHSVAASMLLAGLVSISRIFGKLWFYLTLWLWGTMLLIVASLCWTAWLLVAERCADRRVDGRTDGRTVAAVSVGLVVTALSIVAVIDHEVPEHEFSSDVHAIMPAVADALDHAMSPAPGPDATYAVFWRESLVPASQGFAVLNELERRGYHVGVDPTWRIPATRHRVLDPAEVDAEVHVASGAWIDVARDDPRLVEVVVHDERTDAERARYDELEQRVVRRLTELGRDDLVEAATRNVFGASLDLTLPDDVIDDLSEMLEIGAPIAVFLAPAGTTY